ncbi:Aquaporin [Musa troglodytarum]|uniref:Aquaporin n=1 Tax=Musa troglodytarum TaxID=320322 RepID=A0A9E7K5N2_9LILI|nr:Aquaporin [Musa troglodytarum]
MLDQKEFVNRKETDVEEEKEHSDQASRLKLVVSDSFLSFMWVLSGSVIRYLIYMILGTGMDPISVLLKGYVAVVYLYYFSQLRKVTNGGSYNPLFVLCHAISDNFVEFLYVVFGRIPAQVFFYYGQSFSYISGFERILLSENEDEEEGRQVRKKRKEEEEVVREEEGGGRGRKKRSVPGWWRWWTGRPSHPKRVGLTYQFMPGMVLGSIIGVWLITATFPAAADGPHLNVDVSYGALIEGLITFAIIILSLGLNKFPRSSHKTWISSFAKLALHVLASDITGGVMNPASAFGWAYAQGKHLTKEHLCVYWLAPMEATLLVVWICSLFVKLPKQKRQHGMQYKDKLV